MISKKPFQLLFFSMAVILLLVKGMGGTAQSQTCGSIDNDCEVDLGTYHIALPNSDQNGEPVPALIFFHGAGGSGDRVLKNSGTVKKFNARGYAVIAPDGMIRPDSKFGPGWFFHPDRPALRDDLVFAKQVLDDAVKRFNIDRNRILMSGFSIGGSLVWYMACKDSEVATAYAPVAGAFWRPHPVASDCQGPVRMMHTHGWRDKTVPLEGRPLRNFSLFQGDVFHSLDLMRQVNGCENLRADEFLTEGKFWQRWWTRCEPNSALRFVLHTGSHGVPAGWAETAMDWFEALPVTSR